MIIEDTNTLSQEDLVELIMELGASYAKLDALADIASHMKYETYGLEAIKCVLGIFDEEEEKE